MTDLPRHFEYWREQYGEVPDFTELNPFTFNRDTNTFSVGSEGLPAKEFDPYEFTGLDDEGQTIRDIDQLPKYPVLIPAFGELIVGPKLHEWARAHQGELAEEAVPLMHAVYQLFQDEPVPLETGGGFMSFEAGIREDGAIGLQVLGNCACFGPKYVGGRFEEGLDHDFAEYELHNADTQAQRTSLYAGLGHLAKLAGEA